MFLMNAVSNPVMLIQVTKTDRIAHLPFCVYLPESATNETDPADAEPHQ